MPNGFWRRLLYRWFVEYNPLYLLSAALVLGGTNLLSRGFAAESSLVQMLGGALVAELYAWTLIAGAALLGRIRLTRPAVLLALLAAVYQGDPTLHNETCVYLGWVGAVGSLVWVLSFIAKLRVLAWAMHIRLSRSALYVPSLGAVGFALLPRAFLVLDEPTSTELVGLFAFGLFATGFWTERRLASTRPLDGWGETVFRRARFGIWTLWGSFAVLHFVVWSRYESLWLGVLVPVAALCLTRWLPSERTVWLAVASTLGCIAVFGPRLFSVSAVLAAATLLLRAFREPNLAFPSVAVAAGPYRVPNTGPRPFVPPTLFFARASRDALLRLSLGSVFALYLGIWTHGWERGPWPAHVVALDVALCAVVLLVAWRHRAWAAVAPLGLAGIHLVLQRRMIPAPSSSGEWGAVSIALGFALLLGSLGVAYLARSWRCQPVVGGEPDG